MNTAITVNGTENDDNVELASWNRPRTSEELRSFIESHQDGRLDSVELD